MTYNYNLTVEHQFPQAVLFRIGYVGSQSRHQTERIELNLAVYTPGSTLGTDARRVFKGFASIGQGTQDLSANYNSLQTTLQRRMNSVTLLANYTWSKSLDDVPSGQGNAGIASQSVSPLPSTNPLRHRFDYGRSDFDRRHIITASYVWDLPKFERMNAALRQVAGGWQTTGVIRYQSGQGLTPLAGSDRSQTGLVTDRATQVSSNAYGGESMRCDDALRKLLESGVVCDNLLRRLDNVSSGHGRECKKGLVGWTWSDELGRRGAQEHLIGDGTSEDAVSCGILQCAEPHESWKPKSGGESATFGTIQGAGDPRIGQLALKLLS